MKTKKQLQRELIADERENVRLRGDNEFLKAEKKTYLLALSQAKRALHDARAEAREAKEAEAAARQLSDKLLYVNDVLCAELQQDDQFIDMIYMAVEQLHTRAELLNRISGPLV